MVRTFHKHEREMQLAAGLSVEDVEATRGGNLRTYMPEQHRLFFAQQQLLWAGLLDSLGQPQVLALTGPTGFVKSLGEKELVIEPQQKLDPGLFKVGKQIGMLGIELSTRRRNRINGTITKARDHKIWIKVGLSYGNCPKYIQVRHLHMEEQPTSECSTSSANGSRRLQKHHVDLITRADTFFIATYTDFQEDEDLKPGAIGCDVSHRGGSPGFVQVHETTQGHQIRWPDYIGNNFFNTLGNILANGRAALFFLDFTNGDALHVQGKARVDLKDRSLPGAQRAVVLDIETWSWTAHSLPIKCEEPPEYSPYNPTSEADSDFVQCLGVQDAAEGIKTFIFSRPEAPGRKPTHPLRYTAGQYASFNFKDLEEKGTLTNRTWTISSHPALTQATDAFTITVKKAGLVSGWLHANMRAGQTILWSGVGGEFTPHATTKRALLIAGGIGITPMRAMFHEFRIRGTPTTLLYSLRHSSEAAFAEELEEAAKASGGRLQVHFTVTGRDDDWDGPRGRLNAASIRNLVPNVEQYIVYMCGPGPFMDGLKEQLAQVNVPAANIHTESFNF